MTLPSIAHQYVVDDNLIALQTYVVQNPTILHSTNDNESMYPTTWHEGDNLLDFAAQHGNEACFMYLSTLFPIDSVEDRLLMRAVYNTKYRQIIEVILQRQPDHHVAEAVVQLAIRTNNLAAVQTLLPRCQSWCFNTLLMEAIQRSDNKITHYLLQYFPDTSIDPQLLNPHRINAWFLAAQCNAAILPKIISRFHGNENIANAKGKHVYHFAVESSSVDSIMYLLTQPAINKDYINKKGVTPLMYAIECAHEKATLALIQHGANLFIQDQRGKGLLHYAAEHNNLRCMQAAKEKLQLTTSCFLFWKSTSRQTIGDLVQQKDLSGCTPLHLAAGKKNRELIDFLLDHGADPQAQNLFGTTPIQIATNHNHLETVAQLTNAKTHKP